MSKHAAAALVLVVCAACDDGTALLVPSQPTLELAVAPEGTPTAAGLLRPVTARALASGATVPGAQADAGYVPIAGISLNFASNLMGVTALPASVVTDRDGFAASAVSLPYGSQAQLLVTSAAGGQATAVVATDALALDVAEAGDPEDSAGGQVVTLRATAIYRGAPVPGVALTFATNTSGVTIVPSPAATGADGSVVVKSFVPYLAMPVIGTVTGGGGSRLVALSSLLSMLTLRARTDLVDPVTGEYTVTVALTNAEGHAVPGMSISFAQAGSSASSNPFTPAASTTATDGTAVSHVRIPGATMNVVLTVAGIPGECTLPADAAIACR